MTGLRFSANLGLLWTETDLPAAVRAAAAAGFDAVETHDLARADVAAVAAALAETGLPLLSVNTRRGAPGEAGLAALPGRGEEALAAVTEALGWARTLGARFVHVMAGRADGAEAARAYAQTLAAAADLAAPHGIGILIEPLNAHDMPGYFLRDTARARAVIEAVDRPNLRLLFDCYHVARTEGAVEDRLRDLLPLTGHVQFAAAPDRGPPGTGAPDYDRVFALLRDLGWTAPLGAEYRPAGRTGDSLGWLARIRAGQTLAG